MNAIAFVEPYALATIILLAVSETSGAVVPLFPDFVNTVLAKENGKWSVPDVFTRDLVVVDRDAGTERTFSLKQLFPGKEYEASVVQTARGPIWSEGAFSFVRQFDGTPYFYMRCRSRSQVLVNLRTGHINDEKLTADEVQKAERVEICAALANAARRLSQEHEAPDRVNNTLAAMNLAVRYRMSEVRKDLESIETWDATPDGGRVHEKMGFSAGLSPSVRGNLIGTLFFRTCAKLALRRLGFDSVGFPNVVFEEGAMRTALAPKEKARRALQVKVNMRAQDVFQSIGAPDYLEIAIEGDETVPYGERKKRWVDAWRYDFAGDTDFSILVMWRDDGRVNRVEKIAPALWHGDTLFSDKVTKPVFAVDGSVNGIHLYSEQFLGKIEVLSQCAGPAKRDCRNKCRGPARNSHRGRS